MRCPACSIVPGKVAIRLSKVAVDVFGDCSECEGGQVMSQTCPVTKNVISPDRSHAKLHVYKMKDAQTTVGDAATVRLSVEGAMALMSGSVDVKVNENNTLYQTILGLGDSAAAENAFVDVLARRVWQVCCQAELVSGPAGIEAQTFAKMMTRRLRALVEAMEKSNAVE